MVIQKAPVGESSPELFLHDGCLCVCCHCKLLLDLSPFLCYLIYEQEK